MPVDPSLALPGAPHPLAPLRGPGDALAHAAAARPRPFLLAASGCSLRGTETRGIEAVEHEGRMLLAGLLVRGAACGNVLLAPAQARRELLGPAGSTLETLLASASGLLAQWTRTAASAAPLELVLLVPGTAVRAEGPFLRVEGTDGVRLIQLTPAPSWRIERSSSEGVVRAVAALAQDAAESRMAATSGAGAAAAEEALLRLARTREARAESALAELSTHRMVLHTGVPELDQGLAWAIARVEGALGGAGLEHELAAGEPFPLDPEGRRAWTTLGALAAGAPPPRGLDGRDPLGALARARAATLRGRRLSSADLPALADPALDARGGGAERAVRRAALLEAADALEPWSGRAAAEGLRARAAALGAAGSAADPAGGVAGGRAAGALRLPTLGGAPRADDALAVTLAAALDVPGRGAYTPPPDDPPPGLARALAAWACLNEGSIERGFALFRAHLADGLAHGAGLWPDGARVHDAASAALVPLALAHGLLGARADAHYGRLRLSPRLPAHWTRFEVSGLPVGDATVRMSYVSAGGAHRFRFTQDRGAVPVMLVLEPLLLLGDAPAARIDGKEADLDVRPGPAAADGRKNVRVQLPLDGERELSVE